jgi:hypothetical protein
MTCRSSQSSVSDDFSVALNFSFTAILGLRKGDFREKAVSPPDILLFA